MNTRTALITTAGLLLGLHGAAQPAATSNENKARPNIVFFLADDFGYMNIGANNPKTFYENPDFNKESTK